MILVDTSIWVDHLRSNDAELAASLDAGQVLSHPFVIGELALGRLRQRDLILTALHDLPQAVVAANEEVLRLVADNALAGTGLGYIDAHLLAAARLTAGAALWTRDKRLLAEANRLGLSPDQRRPTRSSS